LRDFQKNTQISKWMKISPVGAELLHAGGQKDGRTDRQTDMTELLVAFCNFANVPNKVIRLELLKQWQLYS